MIISASRRTDIPAFYSEWFIKRIEEGYLYVINPMNRKQVSKIELNQKVVDCIVFWTKDAEPMINKLDILDSLGFKYYFQFTLTSYQSDVEPGLRNKNEIIETFKKLSIRIGKEKVIWRYDPIFLNKKYTKEYHYAWFRALCQRMSGYTDKCVISFLDLYRKTSRNTKQLDIQEMKNEDMLEMARELRIIAREYNITIETCSEEIDLLECGVCHGKCIDDKLIEKIIGSKIDVKKDDTQRDICGCVKSIDIGHYNTCKHYCAYCYANFNHEQVEQNCRNYDMNSPVLVGKLLGDEKITDREMKSIKSKDCYEQIKFEF